MVEEEEAEDVKEDGEEEETEFKNECEEELCSTDKFDGDERSENMMEDEAVDNDELEVARLKLLSCMAKKGCVSRVSALGRCEESFCKHTEMKSLK